MKYLQKSPVMALALVATLTCSDNSGPGSQPPPVAADAGPDVRVYPTSTVTIGFSAGDSSGRHAPWTYQLAWGDGAVDTGSTDSLGHVVVKSHAWGATGRYVVRLTMANRAGVVAADTITAFIDAPGTPEVLIGAGDIGECDSMAPLHIAATAQILDTTPGTVFTLGDNAYPDGSLADYKRCYDPYWGRHRKRTRPTPGNHEYITPNAAGYFAYFGVAAGDPAKGYYSYDLGAWHVVVLNSNYIESQALGQQIPVDTEVAWLRADLAAHPTQCTLAMWHHPRFSSGQTHASNPAFQPLWQALYDNNADLIVNGHEHNYERFAPQTPTGVPDPLRGIRQIIAGTGGGGFTPLDTPPAPNVEVTSTDHGLLKLTLYPASYHWEFVPRSGSTFTDSGTTACH